MSNKIQVELQEIYGTDKHVAEAAWTSSLTYQGKQKRTEEDVSRVVHMLADAKHSTPFESIIFRWWIRMPIAIDRQFMTHRLQSASGMSGRYRTMPTDFLGIPDDIKTITKKVYGSDAGEHIINQYSVFCESANDFYIAVCNKSKYEKERQTITNDEYKRIREFFRGVLPQHNMTERVSVMNLRSWCNFYRLRSKNDAQPEIREVANLMMQEIKKHENIKNTINALEKNNFII